MLSFKIFSGIIIIIFVIIITKETIVITDSNWFTIYIILYQSTLNM